MPSKVSQTNQAPIALNQVFARHSKQKYQWVPALPPRTPTQRLAHAFSSLGKRIAHVVSPNSARTGAERVSSLKAADKEMVNLMAHVLDGTTDVSTLAGDIQRFSASAEHILRTDTDENATLAGLMDIRAKVHIEHMGSQDLQKLTDRLAKAIKVSAASGNQNSLQVLSVLTGIHRQVIREQASRAVLAACKATLQAAPQGPKAVAGQFDQALRAAENALTTLGMQQDGSQAAKSRPYALVKEILNGLLEQGDLPRDSMRAMFNALPSAIQSELLASDMNKKPMFNATGSVDALLKESIAQQWRDLKQAVAEHCEAVSTTNPSKDLPRFADQLTRLNRHWAALQEHTTQHKLPHEKPLELEVSGTLAELSTRLQPEQLQPQLGRLRPGQLVDFSTAWRFLGIENDSLDLLTAEIRKGKRESLVTPGNYLLEACNHISLGQVPQALDWLSRAIDAIPTALETNAAFGNAQWRNGAEGYTAFQQHLIGRALDRLDQKELARLQATFGSRQTSELAVLLQEIGYALEDARDPKGDRLRKMGMALEILIAELAERTTASDAVPQDEQPLGNAAFEAVSQFTKVKVFPSGSLGVVYGSPKLAFQRNVDAILAKPAPAFTPLGQKNSSGVSEAMYLDLKRTEYGIEYSNGASERLFGTQEASRIDQLKTNAGLSAEELLLLSQLANQNLWAGLIAPETSPQDSAIHLPDGTPVNLMGQPKNTFVVRCGPAGELFVRCEQELNPVLALDPATGATTPLDITRSGAWFSVEFEIGKDGKVRISKDLTSSYVLTPAAA